MSRADVSENRNDTTSVIGLLNRVGNRRGSTETVQTLIDELSQRSRKPSDSIHTICFCKNINDGINVNPARVAALESENPQFLWILHRPGNGDFFAVPHAKIRPLLSESSVRPRYRKDGSLVEECWYLSLVDELGVQRIEQR